MINRPILDIALEIKAAVDNNPHGSEKFTELLPGTYYNRNRIHPAFTQLTGCSFTQYRKKKRIEGAADMLSEEKLEIHEVIRKCGYKGKSAQSNFTRDFKDVIGMTPTEWVIMKTL